MLCENLPLDDDMTVTFRGEKHTLKYAIDNCRAGEPIEGIHVKQYDELLKIFEQERGKKFTYSVDIRYGDWRFILFDIVVKSQNPITIYMNPKYMTMEPLVAIAPMPLIL